MIIPRVSINDRICFRGARALRTVLSVCALIALIATDAAGAEVILRGAGATLPFPLYQKWIEVYQDQTDDRITYEPVGSGGGIELLTTKQVDFGGTDAFLPSDQLQVGSNTVLHLPTCLGAVAVIYNLSGYPSLRLTPDILADIFMGKIENWADRAISRANQNVRFPDRPITVVHRSDESGTTWLFTHYLQTVSDSWKKKVGAGKLVRWPSGIGVERNTGVAASVEDIPGSIGYVSETYAAESDLPAASLQNSSGHFVVPSLDTISAAASTSLPDDTRILLTDTEAENGYPITAFTYLIFFKEQKYDHNRQEKAKALASFLWWVIHDGQKFNSTLHFARLPDEAVRKAENVLRLLTYGGKQLLKD